MGFELTSESEKNTVTRVQEVLINFKNKAQTGTQVEKCLVFQKTIEEINLRKDYLEVIIIIEDTTQSEVGDFVSGQSGKMAARIRARAANPNAPARTPSSMDKTTERQGFEPWNPCGLHAFQACRFSLSRISPRPLLFEEFLQQRRGFKF